MGMEKRDKAWQAGSGPEWIGKVWLATAGAVGTRNGQKRKGLVGKWLGWRGGARCVWARSGKAGAAWYVGDQQGEVRVGRLG